MDTSERVRILRKSLNMSQEAFGERLGVKKAAISKIEKGENGLKEHMIKLICREFNVDYFWLTEGTGEMFTSIPQTLVDSIADEYHLTDEYKAILEAFLQVPDEDKPAIQNFFLSIAKNANKKARSDPRFSIASFANE